MKRASSILLVLSFLPHTASACACWSSRDCLYQPSCGDACLFDWATYSYQCKPRYVHTPSPTDRPTPAPTPTPPTGSGEVCGICWSHYDCQSNPYCGDTCAFDLDSYSYQCKGPTGTSPTPRPTLRPTPTPTPRPTPPPVRPKIFGLLPNQCQVNSLLDRMEQAAQIDKAIVPQWLRLAFHDAGTFDQRTFNGGANGCLLNHAPMRDQPENHNLFIATGTLGFIKEQTGVTVSSADLIQFAGLFSVVRQTGVPGLTPQKRQRLLNEFQWGRPDEAECDIAWTQNLPGFILGTDPQDVPRRCAFAGGEIKQKMIDRNGFTAEEATALIGAHTIGLTRNEFGSELQAPWVTNGADDATPEGPVFDNAFHLFLTQDVVANTAEEFDNNRLSFDVDFPTWFRSQTQDLNHLDTDVSLAFPSQDLSIHPHYHLFTQSFANNNQLFLRTFRLAYNKMSRLGVTDPLSNAEFCTPPVQAPTSTEANVFLAPDPFLDLLQATLQEAEENLEISEIEREEEIATLTTPVDIR